MVNKMLLVIIMVSTIACHKTVKFDFKFSENQELYESSVNEILDSKDYYFNLHILKKNDSLFMNTIKLFDELEITYVAKMEDCVIFYYTYENFINRRELVLLYNYQDSLFSYFDGLQIEKRYNENWSEGRNEYFLY